MHHSLEVLLCSTGILLVLYCTVLYSGRCGGRGGRVRGFADSRYEHFTYELVRAMPQAADVRTVVALSTGTVPYRTVSVRLRTTTTVALL